MNARHPTSGSLRPALAAALLLSISAGTLTTLGGCAATRTTQSAGEYVDDVAITTSVKAALLADEDIKSTDINVETFRGDVQLSGYVNNSTQIDRAIALTRKQNGVKNVKNDLRIKTAG
jgi:hypothetical protein